MSELKLSEAIRLGAMLSPHERGGSLEGEGRCALAGVADVCGIAPVKHDGKLLISYLALSNRFPMLLDDVAWPNLPEFRSQLYVAIYSLNDNHGWTREQIADWVETLEAGTADDAVVAPAALTTESVHARIS